MRTMRKNKQTFFEARIESITLGQDNDGNYTEETPTYSIPCEHSAVISPASGQPDLQLFGADEVYDKVITLDKGEDYLKIGSVLWIGSDVELDANGDLAVDENGKYITPYNYVVTKVAESLNVVQVAIRKVTVS